MSAIGNFIKARIERGLRKADIVLAMGYANTGKGQRRLDHVMEGQITEAVFMEKLRKALSAGEEEFKAVVEATHAENCAEAERREAAIEAANRAAFQPHIYLEHERKMPSPIFVVAITGIERWKHIALPADIADWPECKQIRHVKNVILEHQLKEDRDDRTPFGKVTGYAYLKTYDEYVRFDLQGEMLETCSGNPDRNGVRVSLRIGNKVIEKFPGLHPV